MSAFRCEQCGVVENTAMSNYWSRKDEEDKRALCSLCDPVMGKKWHGCFERKQADGYAIGADGFLYDPDSVKAGEVKHTKIVGMVPGIWRSRDTEPPPQVWEGEVGDE